ncbi:MAG: hypothetical protein JO266_13735 [Acidobacteria bacterium]|nr:hypothetical protein [Acidobacteriota bacterium]MBV9482644.1 hypothetical protein [Acidobacteriota bacterium]
MADYSELLAAENNKKSQSKPVSSVKPTPEKNENSPVSKAGQNKDQRRDVTTSPRHDIDYRAWRDIIENTETHNSALRLTREERYEVEDIIQDLERKHKIKTSMNEVARLGLLSIILDYKQNKQQSLLYKIKKS